MSRNHRERMRSLIWKEKPRQLNISRKSLLLLFEVPELQMVML